jgi:hypothetical protein
MSPLWRLPSSLAELTYDQKVLTGLKNVGFEFSQFSKGHHIDQSSAHLSRTTWV